MILSYLIIALSILFAPLALGRPASAPSRNVYHSSASVEPNALLGRHYLVHDRREAPYIHSTPPRPQQTPRHMRPLARYFADRSGDIWIHERPRAPVPALVRRAAADDEARRKYVDYVSHVGPFAYEPPPPPPPTVTVAATPQPSSALAGFDASSSTASPEATFSVMNLAAANATVTPTSTNASPPTGTMEPGKSKKARAKARAKVVHKSGKEYKRMKYSRGNVGLIDALGEAV